MSPSAAALPRRDKYASETRRIWVSIAWIGLIMLPLLTVYNILFDTFDEDRRLYYIVTYMAFWVLMVVIYGVLTLWAYRHRDRPSLERVVAATPPKERTAVVRWLVTGGDAVGWTVSVALLSVIAIAVLLTNERFRSSVPLTIGGGLVVASCWLMMVLTYATTYAREDIARRGLDFGGDEPPVFDDYLYQAITVSTSLAVSDVTATTTRMRRIVRSHALIAFVFNTVIVALLVSLLTVTVD